VAAQGFILLLGQYASPRDVAWNIAVYKSEVEAQGRRFDPMQVGVTRAFFVAEHATKREAAMERRLQNRVRQLKLATRPDGAVHGGPGRAAAEKACAASRAKSCRPSPSDESRHILVKIEAHHLRHDGVLPPTRRCRAEARFIRLQASSNCQNLPARASGGRPPGAVSL
jgi:hypothetical protein